MWFVYIVRCADGSFYTGITNNIDRRVREHNIHTTGSKYVRYRRPVKLVYQEHAPSRSQALKREAEIKKLTHYEKQKLIS